MSVAGAAEEAHVSVLVSRNVDSFESVVSPATTALHQTVSEPLAHEAVDDEVDGAVEDQHHVVDIVHDQQPRRMSGGQPLCFTVDSLVQNMNLQHVRMSSEQNSETLLPTL